MLGHKNHYLISTFDLLKHFKSLVFPIVPGQERDKEEFCGVGTSTSTSQQEH